MRVECSHSSHTENATTPCPFEPVPSCLVPATLANPSSVSSHAQTARPIQPMTSHLTAIPAVTPTITDLLPHLRRLLRTREDGESGNGSHWTRPPSCPALTGLPYYQVAQLDAALYALRGIHLRYHSWSNRAFLNLPLNDSTLTGTPYTVGQTLTAMLYLPEANAVIDTGSHNLQPASHSHGRCNIVLNEPATQELKHSYNLDCTRLIDDPGVLAVLRPGTAYHEPPNLWKPFKHTEIYTKYGLLEETVRCLGYSEILYSDIAFHGSGSSRPDGIIRAAKIVNGEEEKVCDLIIEGKACQQKGSARYAVEAAIQVLFHKFVGVRHRDAEEAVVSIPCQLNKPAWSTIVELIETANRIQYSRHIRKMALKLRSRMQPERMQSWYEQKVHFHNYHQLRELADNRPCGDRKAIKAILDLICWDSAKPTRGAVADD